MTTEDVVTRVGLAGPRRLFCRVPLDWAREAATEAAPVLQSLLSGADVVLVVVGLGAGTGSGAAPPVARAARASGAYVVSVATLAPAWMGKQAEARAIAGADLLRAASDVLIEVPLERVRASRPPEVTVGELLGLWEEAVLST